MSASARTASRRDNRRDNRQDFRRTRRRRRVFRRISLNMYLSTLPYSCSVTRLRAGVNYYYCGGIWYEPRYQGTTIVYVVNEIESGADTNIEFEEDY